MPVGSTPCFPCVPGVGRQLKVQTETHSPMLCMARAQRLRGLSAPLTTRIAHSSQLAKEEGRLRFILVATFTAITDMTWIICFSFVHLLVQDR